MRRRERRSAATTLAVPTLLAIIPLVGLVAGLAGQGRWAFAAWIGVGAPVLVALTFLIRRRHT